jgi:hypothetical protein
VNGSMWCVLFCRFGTTQIGLTALSAELIGVARHPKEMPGAGVGARHPRGLAIAGHHANRVRLAVAKRRHGGNSKHTADALKVGQIALSEGDLAAPTPQIALVRRWFLIGEMLDLAPRVRGARVGDPDYADDVSRWGLKFLLRVGVCDGRQGQGGRDRKRGDHWDFHGRFPFGGCSTSVHVNPASSLSQVNEPAN